MSGSTRDHLTYHVLAGLVAFVLAFVAAGSLAADEGNSTQEVNRSTWPAMKAEFREAKANLDTQMSLLLEVVKSDAVHPDVRMEAAECLRSLVPRAVYEEACANVTLSVEQAPGARGNLVEYPFLRLLQSEPWDVTPRLLAVVAELQGASRRRVKPFTWIMKERWPPEVGAALVSAWARHCEGAAGKPNESLRLLEESLRQ